MPLSFETIDLGRLDQCDVHKKAPTYRYSPHLGSACYGDPPGYPSYFLQSVYTQYGNTPSRGAVSVIRHPDGVYHSMPFRNDYTSKEEVKWEEYAATRLRRLWKPLPLDHERTRLWIRSQYSHFARAYMKPEHLRTRLTESMFFWPLEEVWQGLRVFKDNPRFSEEWRTAAKAEVEAYNADLIAQAAPYVQPDTMVAVIQVREFYPDYDPLNDEEYHRSISGQKDERPRSGDWWTREDTQPDRNECQRMQKQYKLIGSSHMPDEKWCQYCGWHV